MARVHLAANYKGVESVDKPDSVQPLPFPGIMIWN